MPGSVYELAILLSLKDAASGKLDRAGDRLRAYGKDAKGTLQTFQDLRKNLGQQLVVGGVGVGILATLGKGVQSAANYEATLLDLKSAYQEVEAAGGKSAADQAAQLNRLDHLATRLGNNLQGTTGDYVGILASLKKAGVDAETVMTGAGEAAANLANVTGAVTRGTANDQAKQLGQFGMMFKLKPDDFVKTVDLFSALKDRFDIESGELIESAKYFQNTANSLKMTGMEGASEVSKYFALMKRVGAMEGSQAGTSATSFFQQFIAKADQRAKIKKATGLDIKLFDRKGEFLGLENAFKEMEKFRKFSSEKRLEILNEMFGEQGGKVAGVMVEAGAEGWRNITAESAKAVPVNEKINQQMATYNAKLEAVMGTVENLKAITFTPLLNTVKPMLDGLNSGLGALQGFAKENPRIASVGTHLIGLVGMALALKGGFGAMTTAWRLWRITSAMSRSDNLLTYLTGVKEKSNAAAAGIGALPTKKTTTLLVNDAGAVRGIGRVKGLLGGIPTSIKVAVGFLLAEQGIQAAVESYQAWSEADKSSRAVDRAGASNFQSLVRLREQGGGRLPADIARMQGSTTFGILNRNDDLTRALEPNLFNKSFTPQKAWNRLMGMPAYGGWMRTFEPSKAAPEFKKRAPELAFPEIMAEFHNAIDRLADQGKITKESHDKILTTAQAAFPESYEAAKQFTDAWGQAAQQAEPLTKSFADMKQAMGDTPTAFGRVNTAALGLASRLDNLDLDLPYPSFPGQPGAPGASSAVDGATTPVASPFALNIPRRARGGDVQANMPYVVGDRADRRPELFVPRVGGRVLTEEQAGASLMPLFQRLRADARRDGTVVRPIPLTLARAPRVEVMTAARPERTSFFAPARERAAAQPRTQFNLVAAPAVRGDRRPSMLLPRREPSPRTDGAALARPSVRQRADAPPQARVNPSPMPGRAAGGARVEGGRAGITVNGGLHVHVPPGSAAANDPEAFAEYVLQYVTHKVGIQRERS